MAQDAVLAVGADSASQTSTLLNDLPSDVTIYQSEQIVKMLTSRMSGGDSISATVPGFRVQVFSSNAQASAKSDAFSVEKMLQERHVDAAVYVLYQAPFWKVRVGDLLTIDEAKTLKLTLTEICPEYAGETYIVRDQVNAQ